MNIIMKVEPGVLQEGWESWEKMRQKFFTEWEMKCWDCSLLPSRPTLLEQTSMLLEQETRARARSSHGSYSSIPLTCSSMIVKHANMLKISYSKCVLWTLEPLWRWIKAFWVDLVNHSLLLTNIWKFAWADLGSCSSMPLFLPSPYSLLEQDWLSARALYSSKLAPLLEQTYLKHLQTH